MPLRWEGTQVPRGRDIGSNPTHPLLSVAKAPATSSALDAAHMAAAIFLPLVAMVLLVGGVYLYFSR